MGGDLGICGDYNSTWPLAEDRKACCPGAERGVVQIVPLFGEGEQTWPFILRFFVYFLGLVWAFMGVAIIADIFMAAIEEVTMATAIHVDPHAQDTSGE